MLEKFDPAVAEGLRVFLRPDLALGLSERRRAVLHDEVEVRVNLGQLEAESTWRLV